MPPNCKSESVNAKSLKNTDVHSSSSDGTKKKKRKTVLEMYFISIKLVQELPKLKQELRELNFVMIG